MSLEDGDFYFFKGTSPVSAEFETWWVGALPRRKEGRVPHNESLVNSLPQVEPVAQKVSSQRWNWEQQVSRVSRVETVAGGLLALQSEVCRKVGRVRPGILAVWGWPVT